MDKNSKSYRLLVKILVNVIVVGGIIIVATAKIIIRMLNVIDKILDYGNNYNNQRKKSS